MQKKINKTQIFRLSVQIIFLILLPGLFTLAFSQIKTIYDMIAKGNFNFISALPRLAEAIAIFPITIVFGRFFCGWICAFGTFNDLVYIIFRKIFKINFTVNPKLDSILKYLKYVILVFIVSFIWINKSSLFSTTSPWDAFAQLNQLPGALNDYAIGFALLLLITAGAVFIERFFCRYLCPIGGIFAVISKLRIFNIDKPKNKCGKCRLCTKDCSMGIELYKVDTVASSECINCLKCINACPRKNTQATLLEEPVNAALASSMAISAFVGLYAATNTLGNVLNTSNEVQTSAAASVNSAYSAAQDTSQASIATPESAATAPASTTTSEAAASSIPESTAAVTPGSTVTATPAPDVTPVPSSTAVPAVQQSSGESTGKLYKDGTFTGVGRGYRPGLTVSVTIKNDKITEIQVLQNSETPNYSQYPISIIPNEIIKAQSTNVDAVSGATRTSNGIIQAVAAALAKAKV